MDTTGSSVEEKQEVIPKKLTSKELIVQGKNLLIEKKYNKAIEVFTKSIQTDYRGGEAYYWRAFSYNKINEKNKVTEDLNKSAKLGQHQALKILVKKHNLEGVDLTDLVNFCYINGYDKEEQQIKCPSCSSLISNIEKCVFCKYCPSEDEQRRGFLFEARFFIIEKDLRYSKVTEEELLRYSKAQKKNIPGILKSFLDRYK